MATDPLITLAQLALWTQNELADLEADPFALEVITEFSNYARFLGGNEEWVAATAPYDVRRAVLMASTRTYKNPDSEVQTSVGPVSARILDEAALANAFTEAEVAAISGYHPDGAVGSPTLWVQRTTRGEDPLPVDEVLYVPDDQQVGLDSTDSAWPSWDIPMFSPGDPGGEG